MPEPHPNWDLPCDCPKCTYWRMGRDEERAKIVEHLRTHGIGMSEKDAKEASARGLLGIGVAFLLQVLGGLSQGLAAYFERGGHWEPTEGGKARAVAGAVADSIGRSERRRGR